MSTLIGKFNVGVGALLTLTVSQGVLAASDIVVLKNDKPAAASFSALDFASAKPLQPVASPEAAMKLSAAVAAVAKIVRDGSKPIISVAPDRSSRLYEAALRALTAENDPVPTDFGTSGALYSISGMVPDSQSNALTYPHVTTGKLYFSTPGGTASCTAAVIQRRILLTAGHCVANGQGSWYSNFQFVPATYNGSAPLQVWNWRFATTTSTWFSGGGGVPNAADYAMIELEDRTFSGVVRRIGDVTGWLGWQTGSCRSNHVHMLGYPGNVFGGQRLAITSAQRWRNVAPFNCEYGNPQTFGASGGPWIQNFGSSASPKPQTQPGRNRVVTVASYTYGEAFGVLGGSEFDSRFVNLWNSICAHRAGNCS
ncbi:trypsin-like serine peptidase [Methylolobus aquaticus]